MNSKDRETLDSFIAGKQIVKKYTATEKKLRPDVERIIRKNGFLEESRRYIDSGNGRITETDKNLRGFDETEASKVVKKKALVSPTYELKIKSGKDLKSLPKKFLAEFNKYFDIDVQHRFTKEDVVLMEKDSLLTPKESEKIFPVTVSHAITIAINKDFDIKRYIK